MSKIHEISVNINGNIGSSFTSAFRKATMGLSNFQQEARQVQRELDRIAADFRKGKIHESQFREETQKLTRELNKLENAQKRINAIKSFGSNASSALSKTKAVAGVALATGGVAATAALVNTLNTASDFEAQMAKVGAKAEATKQEMQALNQTAIKLGAASSLSSSEVAIAMDELAAKGMNANQIIDAMPGLIAAAEASGENLETVSDVVTAAINSFGLEAKEAGRVADIIAMSANKSAASVLDLGYAFKYAAPIFDTLERPLEELAAATGLLIDKGLAGEQAGTSLRMALKRLSDPPDEAREALNHLGISVVDSKGKFKSLAQITEEWNKATKDLTQTQKLAYASTVFGTEASTAMVALFSSGADKIREMTRALEESGGAAAEAAQKMKDNYAGAKEQLFGAIESSQIAFTSPILPVLKNAFQGITALIEENLPSIESAGQKVADTLDRITKPFHLFEEPPKPEIEPSMNYREAEKAMAEFEKEYSKPIAPKLTGMSFREMDNAMAQYQTQLQKHEEYMKQLEEYELFSNMTVSEKVEYMLNETVTTIDTWMQGEGGQILDNVFSELGTLAGKAWVRSFTTAVTGSVENLFEGNFAGSGALLVAANMMTGGLIGKGALAGGKWVFGKGKDAIKNRKSKKAIETTDTPEVNVTETKDKKNKTNKNSKKSKAIEKVEAPKTSAAKTATKTGSKALSNLGKVGKFAGKGFAPLALLGYGADILTSDNKAQSIGGAAGGLGGAAAGSAAGAAIGSVIPGIGTAVGGLIGGIVGGLGGDWLGGKIGNLFSSQKASAATIPESNNAVANIDTTLLNNEIAKATNNASILAQYLGQASGQVFGAFYPLQQQTNMTTDNMSILTMYSGQASGMVYSSFYNLQQQTNLATNNMSILSMYLGQASGWIFSLNNIQTAGQRVVDALRNLESRINSVRLPSSEGRVSYE